MVLKKLRGRRGLTLAETLTTLALFAILSAALVVGTTAAWKVYQKAVVASEARTLQSTLTQALGDELRYAQNIKINGTNVTFDSMTFGTGVSLTSITSTDGKIMIGSYELLPAKAYTKGLKAEVNVTYAEKKFEVTLTISQDQLTELKREETFTIRALNAPSDA